MKKRKIALFFVLLLAVAAAIVGLRWKEALHASAIYALAYGGIGNLDFEIEQAGLYSTVLGNVHFSGGDGLHIDRVSLRYRPSQLRAGRLETVDISGVALRVRQGERNWQVDGMPEGNGAPFDARAFMASLPFDGLDIKEGMLDVKTAHGNFSFPFTVTYEGKGKPIHAVMQVRNQPLDPLLNIALPDKAKASGSVSGAIPIDLMPDGTIVPGAATLAAAEAGSLQLSPDVLPLGEGSAAPVRDLLGDFHYTTLQIGMKKGEKSGEIVLNLLLEGNNPAVYAGQKVKLNINVGGDVANTLRQTILPMASPTDYLKEK